MMQRMTRTCVYTSMQARWWDAETSTRKLKGRCGGRASEPPPLTWHINHRPLSLLCIQPALATRRKPTTIAMAASTTKLAGHAHPCGSCLHVRCQASVHWSISLPSLSSSPPLLRILPLRLQWRPSRPRLLPYLRKLATGRQRPQPPEPRGHGEEVG